MTTTLTTTNYTYHHVRANVYFKRYLELQTEIDRVETWAYSGSPNRSTARIELQRFVHHVTGRTYDQMCGLRDTYMSVAQLSASMAIMLREQ